MTNIITQDNIHSYMFGKSDKIMELMIFTDSPEMYSIYLASAEKHNNNMLMNPFPDAGFDIVVPSDINCLPGEVTKINFAVKCSAKIVHENGKKYNSGFFMYPRSSLSKTKIRLANSVGIIDSGYRGNLIGAFDSVLHNDTYFVSKHDKLVQICAPGLIPVYVNVVKHEYELGAVTSRGENGFGSTG
jgi:dUTP pyrophosphatase